MPNPWLSRRIVAFAHQAGAYEAPSSTLFAIAHALSVGATAIELDVHATADGTLVVCHDRTVDRTTNGSGAIAQLSDDEVRGLDNAYYFVPGSDAVRGRADRDYVWRGRAPADRRFGVATLDEVLDATEGVLLNLDIKQTAPEVPAYEQRLAEQLRARGRGDDVIVASFHDRSTAEFSTYAPGIGTSPGTTALTMFIQALRSGAGADVLRGPFVGTGHVAIQVPAAIAGVPLVDERLVDAAHQLGLAVHVWTVDAVAEMERLVALGVDGIMTNVPSILGEVLEREQAAWRR